MMTTGRLRYVVMLVVLLSIVAAGCGVVPGLDPLNTPAGSDAPSAASFLPNLPGYSRLEAQTIQDYIVGLGETGAALTGQFEAMPVIALVDQVADCYQNLGVVAASGYSKDDLPIVAGVVAVANRDRLLDPQTFLTCIGAAQVQRALSDGQGGGGMQPCAFAYSTEISGYTYDVLYAGTDLEICQSFCRSLPACTGH